MGTHGLRFLRDFFANLAFFFRKIFVFRIEITEITDIFCIIYDF